MYQHILVPTDGSALSHAAIGQAANLAKALGARVTLVTVTARYLPMSAEPVFAQETSGEHAREMDRVSRKVLAEGKAAVEAAGVACAGLHVENDQPWRAIIDTAQAEGCDLIAMASHGRSGIAAVVLGSETTRVLTHSRIPVIVYR